MDGGESADGGGADTAVNIAQRAACSANSPTGTYHFPLDRGNTERGRTQVIDTKIDRHPIMIGVRDQGKGGGGIKEGGDDTTVSGCAVTVDRLSRTESGVKQQALRGAFELDV